MNEDKIINSTVTVEDALEILSYAGGEHLKEKFLLGFTERILGEKSEFCQEEVTKQIKQYFLKLAVKDIVKQYLLQNDNPADGLVDWGFKDAISDLENDII